MATKPRNILKNYYNSKLRPQLNEAVDEIRHPAIHPKTTAISMALGMFVGIFIPMGFQIWTLAFLLVIIRFNIVIATIVTLISNPFTILPIYYAGIFCGEHITGKIFPWKYFDSFLKHPRWDFIFNTSRNGIFIFLSGLFVMGLFLAIVTYFLALRFAVHLKKK